MLFRAVCVLLAVFPVWAGDTRIDVRVTPPAPSLSDLIRVEVTVSGADASDLILQPADIPPDCVAVRQSSTAGARTILMLDPVKPGPCRIPPFRTRCLHGKTAGCEVRSDETVIPITTMVTSGAELPDIRDKAETPVDFKAAPVAAAMPVPYIPWLAGFVVAILMGVGFRVWRARRTDPARQAQRRLANLTKAMGKNSDAADAIAQLTGIFRDYLDARLALGAGSCTSPEIIDSLRARALGSGWIAQVLEDFLAASDRAKFAGRLAGAAEFDDAADKCLTLVQVLEFDIARRSRVGV